MVISSRTAMTPTFEKDEFEDEVVTWRMPLGDGAVPHVALSDCGHYVRWILDHQQESSGLDLQVAVAHIGYRKYPLPSMHILAEPWGLLQNDDGSLAL